MRRFWENASCTSSQASPRGLPEQRKETFHHPHRYTALLCCRSYFDGLFEYQFQQFLAFVRGYGVIENVNDANILIEHLMCDDKFEFPVAESPDDFRGPAVYIEKAGKENVGINDRPQRP